MRTQAEKGNIFRALHERSGAFIIPNPWDSCRRVAAALAPAGGQEDPDPLEPTPRATATDPGAPARLAHRVRQRRRGGMPSP